MATSRKLENITVGYDIGGKVAISLRHEDGVTDHYLIPVAVAIKFRDKLIEAIRLSQQQPPPLPVPNSEVFMSESSTVRLSNPKEH